MRERNVVAASPRARGLNCIGSASLNGASWLEPIYDPRFASQFQASLRARRRRCMRISRQIHEFAIERPSACRNGTYTRRHRHSARSNPSLGSSPLVPPRSSLLGPGLFAWRSFLTSRRVPDRHRSVGVEVPAQAFARKSRLTSPCSASAAMRSMTRRPKPVASGGPTGAPPLSTHDIWKRRASGGPPGAIRCAPCRTGPTGRRTSTALVASSCSAMPRYWAAAGVSSRSGPCISTRRRARLAIVTRAATAPGPWPARRANPADTSRSSEAARPLSRSLKSPANSRGERVDRAVCEAMACTTASRFLERCETSDIRKRICASRSLRSVTSMLTPRRASGCPPAAAGPHVEPAHLAVAAHDAELVFVGLPAAIGLLSAPAPRPGRRDG